MWTRWRCGRCGSNIPRVCMENTSKRCTRGVKNGTPVLLPRVEEKNGGPLCVRCHAVLSMLFQGFTDEHQRKHMVITSPVQRQLCRACVWEHGTSQLRSIATLTRALATRLCCCGEHQRTQEILQLRKIRTSKRRTERRTRRDAPSKTPNVKKR